MEHVHAKIGNRVFWNDPDEGSCSGPGRIVEIKSDGEPIDDDTVILVKKDDGGEVETTLAEIDLLTDSMEADIKSGQKRRPRTQPRSAQTTLKELIAQAKVITDFEENYPHVEEDEGRLLALIEIAGCRFHVEAIRLTGKRCKVANSDLQSTVDKLLEMTESYSGFDLITIDGKKYIMWMHPVED